MVIRPPIKISAELKVREAAQREGDDDAPFGRCVDARRKIGVDDELVQREVLADEAV